MATHDDPEALYRLGRRRLEEFTDGGGRDALEAALAALREARRRTGPTDLRWTDVRSTLGTALWKRYQQDRGRADLDEALESGREALDGLAPGDPVRPLLLGNQALLLTARAVHVPTEGAAALVAYARAVVGTPVDHRDLRAVVGMLSGMSGPVRGLAGRGVADATAFGAAVAELRAAAATVAEEHPARPLVLSVLGAALWRCSERGTGSVAGAATLDEAVAWLREAVDGVRTGARDHAELTSWLGFCLGERHRRIGDSDDLDDALAAYRESLAVSGAPPHVRASTSAALARLAERRFDEQADPASGEEAATAFHEAATARPAGDPERGALLADASRVRRRSGDRTGDVADLRAAVELARSALRETAEDDRFRPARLSALATALGVLVSHAGGATLLDEAVATHRAVLVEAGDDHPEQAAFLTNLGCALQARFRLTGDRDTLAEATEAHRRAVALVPPGDPGRADHLSNLGLALRALFTVEGDQDVLAEAIEAHGDAVDGTRGPDPRRPAHLENLGVTSMVLFETTGDGAALVRAVDTLEAAVAATPDDDPALAERLGEWGNGLRLRSEYRSDAAALDEAVDVHRRAVKATPAAHPRRAARLNNYAVTLQDRARLRGRPADLDLAIAVARAAVDATGPDHPDRQMHLGNLGAFLVGRADQRGDAPGDEAIRALREAVDIEPSGPPAAFARLNLGGALRTRARRDHDAVAAAEARALLRRAAESTNLPVPQRIGAAADAGEVAAGAEDWAEATHDYATAVRLLDRVVTAGLQRTDQERRVRTGGTLVSDAAACVLRGGGDATRALELLEQGRGILLARALDRSDAGALHEQHPALAERFDDLRRRLDVVPSRTTRRDPQAPQRPVREWDELLATIRARPGFARFLLPPRADELRATAGGIVVVVNVSRYGCHALLLRGSTVRPVALPGLDVDLVRSWVAHVIAALDLEPDDPWAEATLVDVLTQMWDVLAGPVLTALDLAPCAEGPRLWWVPTGLLGLLPLHAAGHHTEGDDRTVMDHVVSSCVPTVRTLQHLRSTPPRELTTDPPLVVAMPRTPGRPPLPAADREAGLLAERWPSARILVGEAAERGVVLDALDTASWVHFACHADSDLVRPSDGGLVLHDGVLSIAEIAALRMPHARLAFLSACSTAGAGARLADESVHVSSAFLLAGYPHVIGTLWPVRDSAAVAITGDVYAELDEAVGTDPAVALHRALRRQRAACRGGSPGLWAGHVHTGP